MALDFLGGIAGAYQAIQKGVDDSKERDYVSKRRQWQDEDRAAQLEDRDYNRGQRQRTIDEQKRADKLRDADAAIPFEVDADLPDALPAPSNKPGGINQKLPATSAPVAPTATPMPMVDGAPTDVSSATPMVDAQAADPKAATPMVEDQAPKPKTLPKRKITYGEYLRQLSQNRRDVGQTGAALELEQKANQWTLDQAGKRLNGLIGASGSMSLEQFAGEAAKMFNEDPLPQSIRSIRPNADGSVTAVISMNDGRYSTEQTFKSKDDMTRVLQSFYQPENFAKLQQAAYEARAKAREELMKPRTIKPGETVQVFNPETGRYQVVAEGKIPAGYEVVEGANGETMLRRFDTGRGASTGAGAGSRGAKVDDPMKAYTDAFEFSSTKGEGKLPEDALARGQSYLPTLAEQGVKPQVAALIARDAAVDPTKTRLEIDHATGRIDRVYINKDVNGGRPVRIAADAGTVADLDKQAGKDVTAIKQDVQTMLGKMVAAAPEDRRQAVMQSYIALASDPTRRNAFLKAQLDAGKAPEAVQNLARQLEIIGNYVKPEAPSAGADPASKSAVDRIRSAVGGIRPQPADPSSPAGQFQARQERARQEEEARRESQAESSRQLSSQFQKDKVAMDPVEFARKYDAIRMKLSASDAAELRRIEQSL